MVFPFSRSVISEGASATFFCIIDSSSRQIHFKMSGEENPALANHNDVQLRQYHEALLANNLVLKSLHSKMQIVESLLVSQQTEIIYN